MPNPTEARQQGQRSAIQVRCRRVTLTQNRDSRGVLREPERTAVIPPKWNEEQITRECRGFYFVVVCLNRDNRAMSLMAFVALRTSLKVSRRIYYIYMLRNRIQSGSERSWREE